jgi:biopolymer transport protein TolR
MAFTTRDGKTQTVLAEINMVPFIDVVLVLLIIFMITAPVIQSGLEVEIPKTETAKDLVEDLLVVTVDREDHLYLQNDRVNVNEIAAKIKEKLPSMKRPGVYLQADKSVSWETATRVLDELTEGGIKNVVIVTEPLAAKK